MTRFANHALAAFAAMIITLTSIGTIVTVPPASADAGLATTQIAELA